jgi:phosphoglycerol transferase MdoB-like AlkP superfamily enzyme
MGKSPSYTNDDVYQIGQNHRAIIWLILLQFLSWPAMQVLAVVARSLEMPFLALPALFMPFAINLVSLYFIFQLASSLKGTTPWFYILLGILPCFSLISLLILSSRAQATLKSHGVAVGLMGAKHADLERLLDESEHDGDDEDA